MPWDTEFRLSKSGFFNDAQLKQIEALFEALHPTDLDRRVPGASIAGAAKFVSLLLANDSPADYYELETWRTAYPAFLDALDATSQSLYSKSLVSLPAALMQELLEKLEDGAIHEWPQLPVDSSGTPYSQTAVFKTLWRHCLQGCWSDPRWGGNQDQVMWRWLGYLTAPQKVL